MAIVFYPLIIKEIRKETNSCVSIAFEMDETTKSKFSFIPGQYLTFKRMINGEEVRRSYSICSSPFDGELRVAVKQVDEGVFSTYVNNVLKVGDVLETMAPQGLFTAEINSSNKKNYVAIVAGSGITPVMSIMKTILREEPKSHFTLIYGNQNRKSIIFKQEIENLKNKYMERLSLFNVLSREHADSELLSGRINTEKCELFLEKLIPSDQIDEVFLCGPEEMILCAKDVFSKYGVEEKNIHFELFFSSIALEKKKQREEVALSDDSISNVVIKLDGAARNIQLGYHGESILDAALNSGADLPFACKGGVCATCRCKIESGDVVMDINYALEKDELEKGFVLACQAHPRSEQVVVNFDVR
jgi:ring-1,2-phenylacetyl-CoA epoxidase subunit PaaE